MVKTLLAQVKEYKRDSILTPVFMILEVIFETLIPLLMASIINDGVMKGDLKHIYIVGAAMFVLAVGGLEVLLAHSMPEGIANLMIPIAVYVAMFFVRSEEHTSELQSR